MFFRPFALRSLCAVVTALAFMGGLGHVSPAQAASGSPSKVKKAVVK